MIIRQYFPQLWYNPYPLYARGLGLCLFLVRWSVICCQDGCFMVRQGALQQDTFVRNTGISTCVYTHICGTSAMDHMTKPQRLDRKYQSSVKEVSVRQYYMENYDNT